MNRRGEKIVFPFTLRVIIAVICLIPLAFLAVSLYNLFSGSNNGEYAKASINLIGNEIERVNTGGEVNVQGISVPNPSGWYIFGFVGTANKPNSCAGDDCLCICPKSLLDILDSQVNKCDKKGSCLIVSNLREFSSIEILGEGVPISVLNVDGEIEISEVVI